ncbi:hypothetical protein H6G76_05660 [Nostoc sp. FACHB-152]|uniref:hypothetical protein n=1 Tax=unclassified Nostoc TaxID=2593658 RepID=UPI001689AE2F|nr:MULTISPECIES: hypothetical protein [unclassified Nostoc]MBD2446659.1 hypothetical protein [Nostoc sp. FACHB-152]MBD2466507.1 hypothetical protein [Nostoc sp. FACHB-145]
MKIHKTLLGLTIGVFTTVSILNICNTQKVKAESVINLNSEQTVCSRFVTGTYLTTIKDTKGKFASRALITLTKEGNLIVTDSNQGGISGQFDPFTTSQGTWACNGTKAITGRALNFSISNQGGSGIARNDYQATFNQRTQTVEGTIELRLFGLQANPLQGNGQNAGSFSFTGQLVTAR